MHPQTLRIYESRGLITPQALAQEHAPLLAGGRRPAAPDPGADQRAGHEPRRRRAGVRARGGARADAPADATALEREAEATRRRSCARRSSACAGRSSAELVPYRARAGARWCRCDRTPRRSAGVRVPIQRPVVVSPRVEITQRDLQRDVPLAPFTTFGIGGPADLLATPRTAGELADAVRWARAERRAVLPARPGREHPDRRHAATAGS